MGDPLRVKAVMVGDYEVLKAHFLMQIAGLYKRDLPVGWLSTQERQVNFMLLDKEINVAVWDTSKFVLINIQD